MTHDATQSALRPHELSADLDIPCREIFLRVVIAAAVKVVQVNTDRDIWDDVLDGPV